MDTVFATSKEISFSSKFEKAVALIAKVAGIRIIQNEAEYEAAKLDNRSIIAYEKQLDDEYNDLQCVKDAKDAQAFKIELAGKFKSAKEGLAKGPLKAYKDELERQRLFEIARREAEAKKAAEAEALRLAKIAAEEAKKAEAEAKRIKAIADKAAAEQKKIDDAKAAAQKQLDDENNARIRREEGAAAAAAAKKAAEVAAAKAKHAAEEAALLAKNKAEAEASEAKARAEVARQAAEKIKEDAKNAPAPFVDIPSDVNYRKSFKYRLTTKRGSFLKSGMKDSLRIKRSELPADFPADLFMLDMVALNDFIKSQGMAAHGRFGLEVTEEKV